MKLDIESKCNRIGTDNIACRSWQDNSSVWTNTVLLRIGRFHLREEGNKNTKLDMQIEREARGRKGFAKS